MRGPKNPLEANRKEEIEVITRVKDSANGNLCDTCHACFADCGGTVEFGKARDCSDNVIACDSFCGQFDPETMTQDSTEGERETSDESKTMSMCVSIEEYWRDRALSTLRKSEKNFEAMDTAMRTDGVPVRVAQSAFEAGLRDLREAIEILASIEGGPQT